MWLILDFGKNVICRGAPAPARGMVQRLRMPVAGLLNSSIPARGACIHMGTQAWSNRRTAAFPFVFGSPDRGAFHISLSVSKVVPTSLFASLDTLQDVNVPLGTNVSR